MVIMVNMGAVVNFPMRCVPYLEQPYCIMKV